MRSAHVLFGGLGRLSLTLIAVACSASCADAPGSPRGDRSVTETSSSLSRIDEVRARFLVADGRAGRTRSALGAPLASSFERTGTHLRPTFGSASTAAHVEIPSRASGVTSVEDVRSHTRVGFALRGARDVEASVSGGYVLYPGAYDGADVIHRVSEEGTEDFVLFEQAPAREALAYDVDVSRAAGLRLVSNTLELLDGAGTPILRVAAPYAVDASGVVHPATLTVEGCAYDTSAAAPWGRAVTAPGASTCTVQVGWHDVAYPALVDPSWTTTGLLDVARSEAAATLLNNGKVLISGGIVGISGGLGSGSCVLYDPATNTFAATGSMDMGRRRHGANLLPSGNVLISGGAYQDNGWGYVFTTGTQIYDATLGTFSAGPSIPEAPHAAVSLASGDVLMVGGDVTHLSGVYSASSNTITATGTPVADHNQPTLTLLPSGKVLVAAGGDYDQGWYPAGNTTAEIFDPAANGGVGAFTTTGSLAAVRPGARSVLLSNGTVLILGGSDATTTIFDPAANGGVGAFSAGPNVSRARMMPSATMLPSGNILIAGTSGTLYDARTELFNPTTGVVSQGDATVTTEGFGTATLLQSGKVLLGPGIENGARSSSLYDPGSTCTFPGAPPTLTATGLSRSIRLNWTAGSPAPGGGYRIYKHSGYDTTTPVFVAAVSKTTLTYTQTGLQKGTSVNYIVKAWNDCNGNGVFDSGIDDETSAMTDASASAL